MYFNQEKHRLNVNGSDLSGSVFDGLNMAGWRARKVNLSGMRLTGANLASVTISECRYDGMTIDGVPVIEKMAEPPIQRRATYD